MKYRVHTFAEVRIACDVEAESQAEALEKVDRLNLYNVVEVMWGRTGAVFDDQSGLLVDAVEYAEDVHAYLVDEKHDDSCEGSVCYNPDHTPMHLLSRGDSAVPPPELDRVLLRRPKPEPAS